MNRRLSLAAFAAGLSLLASPAFAADLTAKLDQKHKQCLERIAEDADAAYEAAMRWRDHGGGRRARHCEAMALFAVGHPEEAAYRLDALAEDADGGSPEQRANFQVEAANFWIAAGEAMAAYKSATKALEFDKRDHAARIVRARAYALSGQPGYAEIDLSSVIASVPNHAEALRYRADARLKQEKLDDAKRDIEASLRADPTQVETALLRGHINEAIRKKALAPTADISASADAVETAGDEASD